MYVINAISVIIVATILLYEIETASSFSIVMMARRGKGNLKKGLDDAPKQSSSVSNLNQGKGQEITGVTLPTEGKSQQTQKLSLTYAL